MAHRSDAKKAKGKNRNVFKVVIRHPSGDKIMFRETNLQAGGDVVDDLIDTRNSEGTLREQYLEWASHEKEMGRFKVTSDTTRSGYQDIMVAIKKNVKELPPAEAGELRQDLIRDFDDSTGELLDVKEVEALRSDV